MSTARLVPSSYTLSNTQYLTISDDSNMYNNVDNTTYATITHTRASSNSTYYLYIHNFNFSTIPSNAIVNSFTVKIRANATGHTTSTSTSYQMSLYNDTTSISSTYASGTLSTTTTTFTFSNGSLTWDTLSGYGNNFRIRVPLRRASSGTADVVHVYGAEIEVNYALPIYHSLTATSAVTGVTISPSTQSVLEGSDVEFVIDADSIEGIVVTDNDTDVTSSLVQHTATGETQTATFIPSSFDTTNSVYNHNAGTDGVYNNNVIENGYTDASSTTRCALYSVQGSGSVSKMYYNFDCSTIPANATITSVSCQFKGGSQGTSYYSNVIAQLTTGTTAKGTSQSISGSNSSPSTVTISGGTWTRNELNNIKILFQVTRGSSNTTTDSTWSFFGATLTVQYTVPVTHQYYWTYTLTNITADHVILIEDGSGPYIPPEEDPTKTYYSLTISSINATTSPANGTTRVEEGTDNTITITPSDPLLTLALDNGVDITSQLIADIPTNTYTVTTQVSGASYGFPLNSSTGYYVSNNNGKSNSAAVCRVNFNFETECLVTISYINYAEATYDYGIFGNIDTALGTTYTADSGAYHTCSASSDNTSAVQTLTYLISAGTHYVDIKYRKDTNTDSNNDSLQWKITSIEPTQGSGNYTYVINDIDKKHSLIFVFGDVTFYYVNSSTTAGARIFPDGQQVKLPGDGYRINIVPDVTSSVVTIKDNGTDRTSYLEREEGTDSHGNLAVSYTYKLTNIQTNHVIAVTIGNAVVQLYVKQNDSWVTYSRAYIKQNGEWVEQADLTAIFFDGTEYRKG